MRCMSGKTEQRGGFKVLVAIPGKHHMVSSHTPMRRSDEDLGPVLDRGDFAAFIDSDT